MKLQICAVGRLRNSPERQLADDYIGRFNKVGRNLGIGPVRETEVEDRNGSRQNIEAELLQRAVSERNTIWCLDERGKLMTSPEFADALAAERDLGTGELSILIGGADGLTSDLRNTCSRKISFGKMVWPHALARVMLTEQLYRAATILAGSPYHRV